MAAVRKFITENPLLSAVAAACILVILIIVLAVSCTRKGPEPDAVLFEEDAWKTNENGFLYYDKDGYTSQFGIDISEWVEKIDFRQIRSSGVEFVILRAGYRGYETGKFVLDNQLASYLEAASAAGLKVGAYFVSQAVNEQEAIEEADFILDHVNGYRLDMPVYIDLESVYDTARTDHLTASEYTKIADAFCRRVEERGYQGGIYANSDWFRNRLNFQEIRQYDIWLAQYSSSLSTDLPVNMWQYTNEGLIDGCEMWVDLNVRVTQEEPAS